MKASAQDRKASAFTENAIAVAAHARNPKTSAEKGAAEYYSTAPFSGSSPI